MFTPDDTIVALSSAAAPSARAIIRLSGPDAFALPDKFFQPDPQHPAVSKSPPWSSLSGRWPLKDDITVPIKIYVFPSPNSYTAENMTELHLPGSPPLTQIILDQLLANGARLAEAGEFTARAFFNGRIDLTQAEAVAQIINARSDDQLRAASRLLEGKLHNHCKQITDQIAELLALIEADIDFSEEDIEFASVSEIQHQLKSIIEPLNNLLDCAISWSQLSRLPQVVLAGRANAGKSTLANALLQTNRAIISGTAGTTRDLLTAPLKLDQGECLLIDTAGLGNVEDCLREQTQHLTRQAANQCDLLIVVLDISQTDLAADLRLIKKLTGSQLHLIVANKTDLHPKQLTQKIDQLQQQLNGPIIPISAAKNKNLNALRQQIQQHLQFSPTSTSTQAVALTARQQQALKKGRQSLEQAEIMTKTNKPQPEFLAIHLREALDHLGSVSGKIVPNDILSIIFKKFCIGK